MWMEENICWTYRRSDEGYTGITFISQITFK